MNELIKITESDDLGQVVSARELYEFLEVKTPFDKWMPRMLEYGFEENVDFSTFLSESTGGRPSKEYALTLDTAKEISMLQRNDKGKQARRYFINCEKALNDLKMTYPQLLESISEERKKLTSKLEELKTAEEYLKNNKIKPTEQEFIKKYGQQLLDWFDRHISSWQEQGYIPARQLILIFPEGYNSHTPVKSLRYYCKLKNIPIDLLQQKKIRGKNMRIHLFI